MAIDLTVEHVLSLRDAARLLPARRRGRKPHVSCLYRWATAGLRGAVLESISIGATKCTSVEALQRFFERLSPSTAAVRPPHTPAARRRHLESVDRQLDAIRDTGGLVGINFGVLFLRDDGRRDEGTSLDVLVRHIDYIAERIGINHVALGSDFDGTTVPSDLKDASGLPRLIEALRNQGFSDEDIAKISFENWIDVLDRSWAA